MVRATSYYVRCMASLNLVQSSSTVLALVELNSELFSKEIKSSFIESQLAL